MATNALSVAAVPGLAVPGTTGFFGDGGGWFDVRQTLRTGMDSGDQSYFRRHVRRPLPKVNQERKQALQGSSGLWTRSPVFITDRPALIEVATGESAPELASEDFTWDPKTPLDFAQSLEFLTHAAPSLSDQSKVEYARFVTERVEPRLGILDLFVLPEAADTLQQALQFFADRFSDRASFEAHLKASGLKLKDAFADETLARSMSVLMRWVNEEAAGFLFDLGESIDLNAGQIGHAAAKFDPNRMRRRVAYDQAGLESLNESHPGALSDEVLEEIYRHSLEQRFVSQRLLASSKAGVGGEEDFDKKAPFYIGEAGLEVFGHVAAKALHDAVGASRVYFAGHYRSGAFIDGLLRAQGYEDFNRDSIRQFLTRSTDERGSGRDMGSHFHYPKHGIARTLSALGMNLAFPLGAALEERIRVLREGRDAARRDIFYAEMGDASTATNEFYEFIDTASIHELPVILNIIDNGVGISVRAEEGRGTVDFRALARSKGFEFMTVDGNDWASVYKAQYEAARMAKQGKRVLIWNQNMPRLNKHSSSSGNTYRHQEYDPLPALSDWLVAKGRLKPEDALTRKPEARLTESSQFDQVYDYGALGSALDQHVLKRLFEPVWAEPPVTLEEVMKGGERVPLPDFEEPDRFGETRLTMNAGIRMALKRILAEYPRSLIIGQDVGDFIGGVFGNTRGLAHLFPGQVLNGQINEPALMALVTGFSLQPGALGIVEMPYDDYTTNTVHRLIQAGLYHWLTGGRQAPHMIVRIPTEPVDAGAIYHSQSHVGLYSGLPGLVVVSPSTTFDAYGLLMSAAQYQGVTVFLEPKGLYRRALGPLIAGEEAFEKNELDRQVEKRGWTPSFTSDPVPLGKALVRKSSGDGGLLTLVSWGTGLISALEAANQLDALDVPTEVIDLRTVQPWDRDAVFKSADKTGALLVVNNGPVTSGISGSIAQAVNEHFQDHRHSEGAQVLTGILGWDPRVPAMPQRPALNRALSLNPDRIVKQALALLDAPLRR